MNNLNLVELFKQEQYEEFEELAKKLEPSELSAELQNADKKIIVQLFTKLPLELSANVFPLLDVELQKFLVENITDIDFHEFSEALLNIDEIEEKINKSIFNEILIRSNADARHEKLLEIIDNIENKKFTSLKPILSEMEPIDIAEIINDVDKEKIVVIFRLLPKDLASDVFVEMDNDAQQIIIKTFTESELSKIINDLYSDDTADIIEEMPSNVARKILKVTNAENRADINRILGFPKDSAGSIMTTECITLRANMTVDEALKKIRRQALDKETIYTCYVTDDKKTLLGIVSARDLLVHHPYEKISSFMQENIIFSSTTTDKEEVANLLSKYDLLAIPIVDSENRILGIVTVDDAIDVIQEEAAEDINKMAGIVASTTKPYLQTNVFSIFKSRIPWLVLLLISATFTGIIINTFEGTLNTLSPLLFACIPMLMGTGGNSGSQASVTIIQALAMDEVQFKDIVKVIWKEIRVAIITALALAIVCFAKLQLIDNLLFGYNYTFSISLAVSISLFVTVCAAKIIGACLPLLAKKCHLDPTVVASPFITTIVDVLSLIIFCNLSILILA